MLFRLMTPHGSSSTDDPGDLSKQHANGLGYGRTHRNYHQYMKRHVVRDTLPRVRTNTHTHARTHTHAHLSPRLRVPSNLASCRFPLKFASTANTTLASKTLTMNLLTSTNPDLLAPLPCTFLPLRTPTFHSRPRNWSLCQKSRRIDEVTLLRSSCPTRALARCCFIST